ncbi:cytochrome c oxidase assembly protein COX16 homolog, mitochondrial-like [Pollicipes pollicipes]|uniref:cytochrome c oxidase assembly protein COX16 homolog, mitochondrial-like n=1 Tax=Pollicipes pollicipes TaxID=41117 RepID=UPI001885854A|nr:cytochrome c oxidase assembly protein COX16 homolog, mitochondrial-like [Pollicipes pollicipes]
MMKMPAGVRRFFSNRLVRVGGPFVAILVTGSFALKEFSSIRYTYRRQRPIEPAEAEKLGIRMKSRQEVRLDQQYQEVQQADIDSWENKRGPRPWEESAAMDELRSRQAAREQAAR